MLASMTGHDTSPDSLPDTPGREDAHAGDRMPASPVAAARFSTSLLSALNIAAYITWLAVCLSTVRFDRLDSAHPREWLGAIAMLGIIALYVVCAVADGTGSRRRIHWVIGQGLLVLCVEALSGHGPTSVLLIIVAGQLVLMMPRWAFVATMLAFNLGIATIWTLRGSTLPEALISILQIGAFQAFAALTGHYAGSREQAREHLAQVNAELLATRRLLEESARAGERLKLSRELHDVAGHSLTALKLNLARLARDPALAGREELQIATQLADELLGQIRQVVSALRVHDGFDLRAAFDALASPLPGVQVHVDMDPDLRVDDIDRAETLLRCAQEAITNAVRHGRARDIRLSLQRRDGDLVLQVDNNGRPPARVEPGNGLTGMRERIAALGGALTVEPTPPQGLRVIARLPERQSRTASA